MPSVLSMSAALDQERSHVNGQLGHLIGFFQVLYLQHERLGQEFRILAAVLVQRNGRILFRALDLDRENVNWVADKITHDMLYYST